MGLRREGRELALQMLYAKDSLKGDLRETLRGFRDGVEAVQRVREFAEGLVQGVQEHQQEIDAAIKARSKNWALSRMPRVDLNIMRLATYELLFRNDIPKKVSINEAI
jgi:N utilization substance protein B